MVTGLIRCLAVTAGMLGCSTAFAMLGGTLDSIEADQVRLGAEHTVAAAGALTMHTLTLPGGGVVHEYLTTTGVVAGVTWSGAGAPNFRQIFGDAYFSRYSAAQAQKKSLSHRQFALHDADLVVESRGGMHSLFSGRAYLPAALPQGVTPDQLQ